MRLRPRIRQFPPVLSLRGRALDDPRPGSDAVALAANGAAAQVAPDSVVVAAPTPEQALELGAVLRASQPAGIEVETCRADELLDRLAERRRVVAVLAHTDDEQGRILLEAVGSRHPEVAVVVVAGVHLPILPLVELGADEVVQAQWLTPSSLSRAVVHSLARRHAASLERRLSHTLHSSTEVVCLFDADLTLAYVSPSAMSVLGWAETDLTTPDLGGMAHPDDRPLLAREWRRLLADAAYRPSLDCRVRHGDGRWVWVRVTAHNQLDDPQVRGVVVHVRDITAERDAAAAVQFQATLLEVAGQPITAIDPAGRVVFWNSAASRVLGWQRDEALGRHILEVVPTREWSEHEARAEAAFAEGRAYEAEYHVMRRNGDWIPMLVNDTPVLDDDGRLRVVISVFTDLTERRATQERVTTLYQLVESSLDAIIGTDVDGLITSWNGSAADLYELGVAEVVGRDLSVLGDTRSTDGEGGVTLGDCVAGVLAGRRPPLHFTDRRRRDGSVVHIASVVSPIHAADGTLIGTSIISRDVTEQVALRRSAVADRQRLAAAQQLAHLGSFEYDSTTGVTHWSDELYAIWGRARDGDVSPDVYVAGTHPEDLPAVLAAMERSRTEDAPVDIVHRIVRDDGEVRWVHVRYGATRTSDGRRVVAGTVHDVTDTKLAELRLARLALHDPLTDLPNRALVLDRLAQALHRSERSGVPVTVLFIDIDRFKIINDGLGHLAGDRALVELASRMAGVLRATDTLGRLAGDEFVVVAEDLATDDDACALAERMVRAVARELFIDHLEVSPTISVGVARGLPPATAESLMNDADAAMYRAKRRGRNRFEMFEAGEGGVDRTEQLSVSTALRKAVAAGEIRVAYQPVMNLSTGRLAGLEALARWRYPAAEYFPTEDFVRVAEESGLIGALAELVVRRALREFAALRARHPELPDMFLSLNLSGQQVAQAGLARWFADELQQAGVPASNVHIELTETALMEDLGSSISTLAEFQALGVQLAIDDFGTGYSSLTYVRRLPVSNLKIDQTFVRGMVHDEYDAVIVNAVVALARALGLQVVAEGIECRDQLDALRRLGCHFGQGYLFSPALEFDAIATWMATHADAWATLPAARV